MTPDDTLRTSIHDPPTTAEVMLTSCGEMDPVTFPTTVSAFAIADWRVSATSEAVAADEKLTLTSYG
jgi:hypothetical protein